jgi:DNA polymerase (family 10)
MITARIAADFVAEYAILLELSGASPFRVRAYANAVRALETLSSPLDELLAAGTLTKVKGIGDSVAELVAEFADTGTAQAYEKLQAATPEGLLDMLRVPGLGPRKIVAIRKALGIETLDALEQACRNGQLAALKGFGSKTQANILKGVEFIRAHEGHCRVDSAHHSAQSLLAVLRPYAQHLDVAGELRRARETVQRLDFVLSTTDAEAATAAFVSHPDVAEVLAPSAGRLSSGLRANLHVVPDDAFSAALHYYTGSEEHRAALRTKATERGLVLDERGLWRGDERIECADEAALFAALGLAYIPPELRENQGEVAAAAADTLPELVTAADIRGMLHVHSTYSDGTDSLEAMARAVEEHGFEYMGIADHSQAAAYAGGLRVEEVQRQWEEIDRLNEKMAPFRIFKGIESDILSDGSLDYDDDLLAQFDFVVASVHSQFNLSRDAMTTRIVRAIEHPATTIVGHPTGRLLLDREGYAVDIDPIIEAAARGGVALEINAHPSRLDLDWRHVKKARDHGVQIAVNTDAHSVAGLDHLGYGIGIARKGWLRAADIPNALNREAIAAWFQH